MFFTLFKFKSNCLYSIIIILWSSFFTFAMDIQIKNFKKLLKSGNYKACREYLKDPQFKTKIDEFPTKQFLCYSDYNNNTDLHLAVQKNMPALIKFLINDLQISPNVKNKFNLIPLDCVLYQPEIINILLNKDTLIKRLTGARLAYWAIQNQNVSLLQKLISLGIDVNAQHGAENDSLLEYAFKSNVYETVELLLQSGANVNTLNLIPHNLAATNNIQMLKILIQYGISINTQDDKGRTALHYAVINNHHKAMQALLEAKIDKQITDKFGKTANQYFIENRKTLLAQLEKLYETGIILCNSD